MLTKKDLTDVKKLVVSSLSEFFEKVLVPYLDNEHEENQVEHEKTRIELGDKIELINEHLNDHEKRITKLEDVAQII